MIYQKYSLHILCMYVHFFLKMNSLSVCKLQKSFDSSPHALGGLRSGIYNPFLFD